MSQRRPDVYDDPNNRRSQSHTSKRYQKKNNYQDFFESQDIWKNLDRIRYSYKHSDKIIKHSYLLLPFEKIIDFKTIQTCISKLHDYVDEDTLKLQHVLTVDNTTSGCIILKNFTVLDCCLTLIVIVNLLSQRFTKSLNKDYFTIPNDAILKCKFYVVANCRFPKNQFPQNNRKIHSDFRLLTSDFNNLNKFKEVHISTTTHTSLTYYMDGLAEFISELIFGKYPNNISRFLSILLWGYNKQLRFSLSEVYYSENELLDNAELKENNKMVEQSKKNLDKFKTTLKEYNYANDLKPKEGNVTETVKESTRTSIIGTNSKDTATQNRYFANRGTDNGRDYTNMSQNPSNKPGFLTQEQIKEHCIANIDASKDIVKTKSPYEIFKMYIKIPKLKYIDMIYQNLNDLRAKTNCNIVVLNLNNLHESEPWFNSLKLASYTSITQFPHPSTVRVVSIGGVSEYVLTVLDLITEMMQT